MFHLIKYSVIRKVKNFSMLFWPCMFPLILGTLFYFAFGNISESDFETVQAAFVEENPGDSVFPSFLEEVSKEETLIHVETMTEKEALQKLEDQKISGIFYGTETPYLKVGKNGLAQSIMQSLLESYLNGKDTLETVADVHPENMKKAVAAMSDYQELVENVSAGGRTTNGNMGFFYALAAMACMYGCFIGLGSAMWLQALDHSLKIITVYDDECPIGMGRIVGDGAVICYIQDLIIIPEYQSRHIGSMLIERLIAYVKSITLKDSRMMLCLMCAKGREVFYEKHGFTARPTRQLGPGMIQYIRVEES